MGRYESDTFIIHGFNQASQSKIGSFNITSYNLVITQQTCFNAFIHVPTEEC